MVEMMQTGEKENQNSRVQVCSEGDGQVRWELFLMQAYVR